MPQGTCTRCDRSFRLPEGRTRGRCPRCGSRLHVASTVATAPEQVACDHCGHPMLSTDDRCLACGALRTRDAGAEGTFGHHQWVEAYRTFSRVRITFFWAGAAMALYVAIFGRALMVGTPNALIPFLVTSALLSAIVTGWFQVPRKPYGWTLALAIGYTLFTLLAFGAWFLLWLTGSPFRMYALGFNIALLGPGTLGLWAAVGKAASVRSLLKIHPDLFVVKIPKRGERRAERPRDVSPGMIKLARESRDRTRRIIYYATVPLLGTILLFSLVDFIESGDADDESGSGQHESTDCPPFRDTLAHLKASWNAGDEEALVEMVAPARRAAFRRVLAAKRKKYEWGDRLRPIDRKLGEYYQYDGCPQLAFFFEIEGCLVVKRVRFRLKHLEGEWVLTGVTFLDS